MNTVDSDVLPSRGSSKENQKNSSENFRLLGAFFLPHIRPNLNRNRSMALNSIPGFPSNSNSIFNVVSVFFSLERFAPWNLAQRFRFDVEKSVRSVVERFEFALRWKSKTVRRKIGQFISVRVDKQHERSLFFGNEKFTVPAVLQKFQNRIKEKKQKRKFVRFSSRLSDVSKNEPIRRRENRQEEKIIVF